MRSLALFFAFNLIAAAQTITALPQCKITLSGSATTLQVTNGGSHAIAGVVLAITFAHGGPKAGWKGMIVPGMIPPDWATHPLYIPMPGGDVSEIALDAVVFDNGTYVGPDVTKSFDEMRDFVADAAAVSSPLLSAVSPSELDAAWATIASLAGKTESEISFAKISCAKILLSQHGKDDTAAMKLARIYVQLSPLTKVN